jgi:polyisoprenoid-binding protein YceI
MATLGPGDGSIKVRTRREGLAQRVGHDLTLEATRWNAEVELDPDDITRSSVAVTVDPGSFEVLEGTGGAMPLSDKDRADIRKNITQKVLTSGQVGFRSTGIESLGEGRFALDGDLTQNATSRPVRIELAQSGDRVGGRVTIRQTEWGIKPYSAMLGALKVADAVEIEVDVRVPTG